MKQKITIFIVKKLNILLDKLGYDCCIYVENRDDGYCYVSRNAVTKQTTKMFDAMLKQLEEPLTIRKMYFQV